MALLAQFVGRGKQPHRGRHLWVSHPGGDWKCVLCGGVAREPTLDDLPDRFEPLTDQERALCPWKHARP
jgi:hypothetical protein